MFSLSAQVGEVGGPCAQRVQDAFESRDAAEERAQVRPADAGTAASVAGGAASGGATATVRWRRAAEAEASARRLLQATMEEFYGAAADAAWLETQGVAVGDLLADGESDGAGTPRGGVSAEGTQAEGKRSAVDKDMGTAAGSTAARSGDGGEQGGGGSILGRFFGM